MSIFDINESLNKKASTGFPYNNSKYKVKRDIINQPFYVEMMEEFEDIQLSSEPFNVIWQISEKYEMRSHKKLDNDPPLIRAFLSGPLDHVVLTNKYCLHFNEKLKSSHHFTSSKIGMTKYYNGWGTLYSKLSKFKLGFSLDCKNFDVCVFRKLFKIVENLRLRSFGPNVDLERAAKALKYIYDSICYGFLIFENGEIVSKLKGNTSGQGNTLVDNTLVSYIIIAYAYIVLANRNDIDVSYSSFNNDLVMALCGDDNTCSVSESIVDWFNFNNISTVFLEIGFTCTCDFPDFAPIKDLEFLSHKFLIKLGKVYPVPDANKMVSSAFYGDVSFDPRWVFMRLCALRVECYGLTSLFKLLTKILDYILLNYKTDLIGVIKLNNGEDEIKWESIFNLYFSEKQIQDLYFGMESYIPLNPLFKYVVALK